MSQVPKKVTRKPKPADLPLPPKDKCTIGQAEVINVNERTGHLLLQTSSSGEKHTIHHSLVMDDKGSALTDCRNVKGRVIAICKYPDRTDYLLMGEAEDQSNGQTIEESQAIVLSYEEPNFTLWFWEVDQKIPMHIKKLKLEDELFAIDPNDLYNSVLKIGFDQEGVISSATIAEYRPRSTDVTAATHEASSPADVRKRSFGEKEPLQSEAEPGEDKWKAISTRLIAYIEFITQRHPASGDSTMLKQITQMIEEVKERDAGLSQMIMGCVAEIEAAELARSQRADQSVRYSEPQMLNKQQPMSAGELYAQQTSSAAWQLPQPYLQPPPSDQQSLPFYLQSPASGQQLSQSYQHEIPQSRQLSVPYQSIAPQTIAQPAPDPNVAQCESCRSVAKLYQFCDHRMCRDCISNSAFMLKCQVCAKPQDFSANLAAFDDFYGTECNGCHAKKMTIVYCTHRVCKDCILILKQCPTCFICDAPMAQGYHNQLLTMTMVCCRHCATPMSGIDAFCFDCSCKLCYRCTASSLSFESCVTCGKSRTGIDKELLRPFYQR
jgi:hypothetical protein